MTARLEFRTCPLCEATCGLEIAIESDGSIGRVRGDRDDVFSRGFICPKGSTVKQLHLDPDRLRVPQIREGSAWRDATWDEAFRVIADRLPPIMAEHGSNAVGVYLGNPNVHNMSSPLYGRVLLKALRSRSLFSASTVDQMPKHVSSGLMFGHPDSIPVPDLDRTDYLMMLGANPWHSNGSLATAPDFPGRVKAIQSRGGKVVVVDPRRSRTAVEADEHIFIRPGTDAAFLYGIVHELFEHDLVAPGRLADHVVGIDELAAAALAFTPDAVEAWTGVPAATVERIARELAEAPTAVVYGRIGTHTVRFGTVASWLVDAINVLTGNLDSPGGAMFPMAAHERRRNRGSSFQTGRWASRVKGYGEVRGELPVSTFADEIESPGDGQIRAVITIAGNPVRSTPNSDRLEKALRNVEFMVSVDVYRNETTGLADVILPAPSILERSHYDLAFTTLSVRNVANYSPPVFPLPAGTLDEWEVMLRLAAIVSGSDGGPADVNRLDDETFLMQISQAVSDPESNVAGRDPSEIAAMTTGERGPERLLDVLVRTGPYGDGYGTDPEGLTLERLKAHPHGIDLGPLAPRLPGLLNTPTGKIDLAPAPIVADTANLVAAMAAPAHGGMVLVGRRHVRSNNSWMHNVEVLVKGKDRCTLHIHPEDAADLGIAQGAVATVTSRVGEVSVAAELTDAVMRGVVSLPHGWGHDADDAAMAVAARHAGANSNALTDEGQIDPLSGNAVLNGIPVVVAPA